MPEPLATPGPSLRIMIVDDDELVRDSISAEVESLGHHVIPADSGSTAIALLAAGAVVDTILSDLHLQAGMDGQALLARIRRDYPQIRTILMSGSMTRDARMEDDGIVPLPKPFTRAQLRAALLDGS